jgi:hypothetical protein
MIPPPNYAKRSRDLRLRSPDHLRYIRQRLCVLWAHKDCEGKVEACHLRGLAPEKGMGNKPSDLWTVGMCRKHHRESQDREREFQERYNIDLVNIALEYAEQSRDKRVKAAAEAIRELMKMHMTQDEFAEMVEAVMKKIRDMEHKA